VCSFYNIEALGERGGPVSLRAALGVSRHSITEKLVIVV
jgi:hypothetical protein